MLNNSIMSDAFKMYNFNEFSMMDPSINQFSLNKGISIDVDEYSTMDKDYSNNNRDNKGNNYSENKNYNSYLKLDNVDDNTDNRFINNDMLNVNKLTFENNDEFGINTH